MSTTAIIGAGIGGIATAIRLAARGYDVHLFDKNPYPGGKLSQVEMDGYRFDAGPSLFTMPQYVEELFRVAGKDMNGRFSYDRLDTICNYFWSDGTSFQANGNLDTFVEELNTRLGVDRLQARDYLRTSARKYEQFGKIFLEKSLHRLDTWTNRDTILSMLKMDFKDLFKSLHNINQAFFKDNEKVVQLFDRYATYNGSNPYRTPGMMAIIPHFEYGFGAYFPKGGMISITESLMDLAREIGVQVHLDCEVEEITTKNDKVEGVKTRDDFIQADIVVSNADVITTYKHLLPDYNTPRAIARQERSTSALVYYWGVESEFPQLGLHNIFFSDDYKREFESLREGKIADDPTIYINITSKMNPDDAPQGCENWFILINAPHHVGQEWDSIRKEVKDKIIEKLNACLQTDVSNLIACASTLDPESMEEKTSSYMGSLYGTSSNSIWSAFLRHRNKNKHIEGLYHCGGSVHPGGGIPLCLLSAKIVDELIEEELA